MYIPDERQQLDWIPVSKRLPKPEHWDNVDGKPIRLTFAIVYDRSLGIKIGVAYFTERGLLQEWRTDEGNEVLEGLTHWMPLPEMPRH